MTADFFKGLPTYAQVVAKIGMVGGILCLVAYMVFAREGQHSKLLESVQKTNETNSATISRQTEILADIKEDNSSVRRDMQRMADTQERTTKALERLIPQAITKADR